MDKKIELFFTAPAFAVAGASTNRDKFGNKVLRCYIQNKKIAYPINPNEKKIEGISCFKNVADLPDEVQSLSIVTPPNITQQIVDDAIQKGIKNIWMQPGAENDEAIKKAEKQNINVIANGPCILVTLGFED